MPFAYVLAGCGISHNCLNSQPESELLCDWRFTGNQFVFATSSLRLTTSNFIFQLNIYGYSPYLTSSLARGWVCHLQLLLALTSAVLIGFKSLGDHDHIVTCYLRSQPIRGSLLGNSFVNTQQYWSRC
jgi:hypothetical protein